MILEEEQARREDGRISLVNMEAWLSCCKETLATNRRQVLMTLDYQLQDNQVAILWYDTREVQIMNVPNLDEIEDMEQYFSEVLELDMSNAYYMT